MGVKLEQGSSETRGTIQQAGAAGAPEEAERRLTQPQAEPRTGLRSQGPPGGSARQEREGRKHRGHPLSRGGQGQDEDRCTQG